MAPSDAKEKQSTECSSTEKPKRRVNKPLIEKRRRERINECLNQLQGMITQLDKEKSKTGRPAKLEKADILEMTVEFVRKSRSSCKDSSNEQECGSQYLAGYLRCVEEIGNFFNTNKTISKDLQTSILKHVDTKLKDSDTETFGEQQVLRTDSDDDASVKTKNIKPDPSYVSSNNISIQPKLFPSGQLGNHGNAPVCITAPQVIQQKANPSCSSTSTNMAAPMTLVCNRELPTFVLVPTATLCHSVQLPVGSQNPNIKGLPITVMNTSPSNLGAFQLNTTANETITNLSHPCVSVHQNATQVMIIPKDHTIQEPTRTNITTTHAPTAITLPQVNSYLREPAHLDLPELPLNLAQGHHVVPDDSSMWRPW